MIVPIKKIIPCIILVASIFINTTYGASVSRHIPTKKILCSKLRIPLRFNTKSVEDATDKNYFFDNESIDRVLRLSDTSLQRIRTKLADAIHLSELKYLEELKSLKSKDEIREKILSGPIVASIYFPMAYNSVSQHFTVSEFLELILEPKGTWGRSNRIFRWVPLICPFLEENGIQNMIIKLIENERNEDDILWDYLYEDLVMYNQMWIEHVEPQFAEQLLNTAFERKCDFALFNFMPWDRIPKYIREKRLSQYIKKPFDEIQVTDKILPVKSQDQYAGTCATCQDLHWQVLMEQDFDYDGKPGYGKVGIIRINGEAIFSLKLLHEHSMVALRTMRTPDGRLATVRGALYVPSKEISELFKKFDYKKDTFMIVDIDKPITILPIGWVDILYDEWSETEFILYHRKLEQLAVEASL